MRPEQLPNICNDLGIQKEVRESVSNLLKRTTIHADTANNDLEQMCYHAMMDGMRRGFNYGWLLCERKHEKQPNTAAGWRAGD